MTDPTARPRTEWRCLAREHDGSPIGARQRRRLLDEPDDCDLPDERPDGYARPDR